MRKPIYLINPVPDDTFYFARDWFVPNGLPPAILLADLTIPTVAALVPAAFNVHVCEERIAPADLDTRSISSASPARCVELRCGPHLLILDAGSGLRGFGQALEADGRTVQADLLLSHTHLDHIGGMPFFGPGFRAGTGLRLRAGHLSASALEAAGAASLRPPLMPDLMPLLGGQPSFHDFDGGAALDLHPGLHVTTAPLNHPGGAPAYQIDWAGRCVAYVIDHEHGQGGPDAALLAWERGADVMIYDATYTDAAFPACVGWGHSTWQEALRLADAADVGRTVLFHHDPGRNDDLLRAIDSAAGQRRPGTLTARETMEMTI